MVKMGGLGSGFGPRYNRRRGRKQYVSELKSISARLFSYCVMQQVPEAGRETVLCGLRTTVHKDHLELYRNFGKVEKTFRISLCKSLGHYGNNRYWFECPSLSCSRRCGKLYLQYASCGTPIFACRICLDLVYRSQHRSSCDRLIDKKWRLINKLGGDDFVCIGNKPKAMHWSTFNWMEKQLKSVDDAIFTDLLNKSLIPGFFI